MGESLLKLPEVMRRTSMKKSSIYARIAAGTFPKPVRYPDGIAVAWLESEIDAWIDGVIKASRGGSA